MPEGHSRTSFLGYIHSLRGLAILMVIAFHVGDAEGWSSSSGATRYASLVLSNATVPFMFVSGFLFQHLLRRFSYGSYLRARLSKLVAPYIVISIPSLLHQYLLHNGTFSGAAAAHPVQAVIRAYCTGAHMAIPFWYIPIIVIFTLVSPLWVMMDRSPRSYLLIIPGLILSTFIHRSFGHACVLQSAAYFLPVYWAGMWMSHYSEQVHDFASRKWHWLAGATIFLLALECIGRQTVGPIYSYSPFSTEHGVLDIDIEAKLLLTIVVAQLLRRYDSSVRRWLSGFANASFGMFFLHEYVIIALRFIARKLHQLPSNLNVALVIVSVPAVIACTFFVVLALQRLLGQKSRFVIGS